MQQKGHVPLPVPLRSTIHTAAREQGSAWVIEDEPLVAMLIEDMLSDLGYSVSATAHDLAAAEQLIAGTRADLAVVDLNLNGVVSFRLPELLSASRVPFILATGYGAASLPPEWAHVPALDKPFQIEDLEGAIAKLKS